jgi:hypothetical protein
MAVSPAPNYTKVVSAGKGYVIANTADGKTVKVTGARNWRNNNPGNLVNATAAQGVIGRDVYGDPVFATYEQGLEAQRRLLFVPGSTKQNYASKTLRDAMFMYTPPVVEKATGQKGDPEKYIKTIVAGVPGITAKTVLGQMTPAQQRAMLEVIHKVEGYKAGTVTLVSATDGGGTGGGPPPPNLGPKPPTPVNAEVPQYEPEIEPFYRVNPGATPSSGTEFNNPFPGQLDFTQALENILHQYPSYTYGLSLHLLTTDEYNGLVSGDLVNYQPVRVLIASAGRYNTETGGVIPTGPNGVFNRSPYFSEDFYFDGLTMNTVIGVNQTSRNTNAIEFNFTLLEPYGMTLINRLLDQANDPEMNCSNYLDMVYLLQIDFFASDDTGVIIGAIPETTKRIPIKITQMNIKTGVRGSEYQINAVPYNHTAFEQTVVGTPANFEVTSGTVSEFFTVGTDDDVSFADALNTWYRDLAKNHKIRVPDIYTFDIHPSIASATFSSAGSISNRDTPMTPVNNTKNIRLANTGNNTKSFNTSKRNFTISAGTSIDRVIDYVVRSSSYIQDQVVIPDGVDPITYLREKTKFANKPLNWYRIIPSIQLGDFDPVRKIYGRIITYSVVPYVIYNVKSDVAPQGKISNFVKQYNYLYTGENSDVLDFNIEFNTLYYTAQTAYRSALTDIYKVPDGAQTSSSVKNSDSYQGATQSANSVMPMVMKPQVFNAKSRATGGVVSAKNVAVADLEDSLMTLSSADMLNVQLKIIGDPQFIKQDDCFYSPLNSNIIQFDPRLTPNNSLRTDYGEIYVLLTFRTPIDIDESTGMTLFNDNYKTSVFSGIYKVLTVASEFRQGQFTQTLDLIRIPYQADYDYVYPPKPEVDERASDLQPQFISAATNNTPALSIGTPPKLSVDDSAQSFKRSPLTEISDQLGSLQSRAQKELARVNNLAPTQLIGRIP